MGIRLVRAASLTRAARQEIGGDLGVAERTRRPPTAVPFGPHWRQHSSPRGAIICCPAFGFRELNRRCGRWKCGNLAFFARFPRGGGKSGKPVFWFSTLSAGPAFPWPSLVLIVRVVAPPRDKPLTGVLLVSLYTVIYGSRRYESCPQTRDVQWGPASGGLCRVQTHTQKPVGVRQSHCRRCDGTRSAVHHRSVTERGHSTARETETCSRFPDWIQRDVGLAQKTPHFFTAS